MNKKQSDLISQYQIAEFDELHTLRSPMFNKGNKVKIKEHVEAYLKDAFMDGYVGVHYLLGVELIAIGLTALVLASVMKKTEGKTFADRIDELPENFASYELERIVFTEGHRVYVEGQNEAAKAIQSKTDLLVFKKWDATMDTHTRLTHALLNGQMKRMEEKFTTVNGSAMAPGQFGIAEEDINCRCILSFESF